MSLKNIEDRHAVMEALIAAGDRRAQHPYMQAVHHDRALLLKALKRASPHSAEWAVEKVIQDEIKAAREARKARKG